MIEIPIRHAVDQYRGAKPALQLKSADRTRLNKRITDHINRAIAANPDPHQQLLWGVIAIELHVSTEDVRRAFHGGGYNGITLAVTPTQREALDRYLADLDWR